MLLVKNIHSMEEKISISRVVVHDGIRDMNSIFLRETFMLMQEIVLRFQFEHDNQDSTGLNSCDFLVFT